MNFQLIVAMAKKIGVPTQHVKKVDLIRAIQRAEHNIDCYGTERVAVCREEGCLWREDCLKVGHQKKTSP